MKLDAIIYRGTLPSGIVQVAAITNKTAKTRKVQRLLASLPRGRVRARSLFTQTNTVMLLADAIKHSVPFISSRTFNL